MINVLYDEHQVVLKKLLEKDVDFILVGGYAVIAHGYERTTGDMDIWLRADNENKLVLLDALRELDFDEEGLDYLRQQNFEDHYVFSIGDEPLKIDFITHISGVTYQDAKPEIHVAEVDGLSLPILHLHHLVLSKIANGRLKDKADIEQLQRIARQTKNEGDTSGPLSFINRK